MLKNETAPDGESPEEDAAVQLLPSTDVMQAVLTTAQTESMVGIDLCYPDETEK